jgi:hypothetical protein
VPTITLLGLKTSPRLAYLHFIQIEQHLQSVITHPKILNKTLDNLLLASQQKHRNRHIHRTRTKRLLLSFRNESTGKIGQILLRWAGVSRYLPASHTDHLIHSSETRLKHFLFSPDVSVADVSYEPPTHGGEHDPQQNSYLHDKPYEPDEDS